MYKSPLVITDNIVLALHFQTIWNKYFPKQEISFLISKNSNLSEFEEKGIKAATVDLKQQSSIDNILERFDIVFSIHSKQIFPERLVSKVRCINIHPGYNPYTRGWYPQVFAILNDLPIGVTIHEIDNKLDHGPIIARKLVKKYSWDTSKSLYDRVVTAEIDLLNIYLPNIINNNYVTYQPEEEGEVFLKKDFNKLCHIDLNEQTTLGNAIDKLRALTHGEFNNAYFVDKDGHRVYIKISLKPE